MSICEALPQWAEECTEGPMGKHRKEDPQGPQTLPTPPPPQGPQTLPPPPPPPQGPQTR